MSKLGLEPEGVLARSAFLKLLDEAKHDENVLGLVVAGSRGKGLENARSDYDLALFVRDDALQACHKTYSPFPGSDLFIFTLKSFEKHAAWGSDAAYDRYNWAHLKPEFDRSSTLQPLMDEKSRVPAEHAQQYIHDSLDGLINQVYRSLKCHRADDEVGYRLEASELVRPFLQAVFCLHERRTVPYYKYLAWELKTFPLKKLALTSDDLMRYLLTILNNAAYRAQQTLLREAERVFRAAGYGSTFDAWHDDLFFCLNYSGRV